MRNSIQNKIAKDISGKTPYIKCTKCGKKIDLTQNGVSERLKNGWEKCCGYTMRYYPD